MSTDRITFMKSLLTNVTGAQWYKVNLHTHAAGHKPEDVVDAAINAGIQLIAITDHNSFRHIKPVQNALSRRTDTDLVILPGIEITLHEGAHIIAAFDMDFDETKQAHFLGALGIPPDGNEKSVVRDKTCTEVLTTITDNHGITVVPHPFSEDIGFLDAARKIPTKMEWLESGNIGLIQIPENKVVFLDHDDKGKWQNRFILASTPRKDIPSTDYCLAPINQGEALSPAQMDSGTTWLKLGCRSVKGLRQVTCEPQTCISRTEPSLGKNYRILGLTVTGGFFDGLQISFSEDFTCIFGENHSGKSAVFDFVSFALGRDTAILSVNRDEELNLLLKRLLAILQPGGKVDLFIQAGTNSYCLSRRFEPEYDKYSEITGMKEHPQAYRYSSQSDELIPTNLEEAIFYPEIYSQGHVGALRKSYESQLSLIDELAGLSGDRKTRKSLSDQLQTNAGQLATLYDERETLQGKVGSVDDLEKQHKELSADLEESSNSKWEATKTLLSSAKDSISNSATKNSKDGLESKLLLSELQYEADYVVEESIITGANTTIRAYNSQVQSSIAQINSSFKALSLAFSPLFDKWSALYNGHKNAVTQILRDKGYESPEQLLNKIETLATDIAAIKSTQAPRLKVVNEQIAQLIKARKDLLSKYRETSTTIEKEREAKIDELNKLIAPDMRIEFIQGNKEEYLRLLLEIYSNIAARERRLQRRDEQLSLVVNKTTPYVLLAAIKASGNVALPDGTTTTLAEYCGITENTQQVLCSIVGTISALHKLEIFTLEPVPKIFVKREGTGVFANLTTELSPGEQSAAILTLALMARDVPLLIDQPEDELGYSYIVNKIVPKILSAKRERQIVLISHNANVPVLADADLLIKVRNDPVESKMHCSVEAAGTFADDRMCQMIIDLEGGERAFQIRQYRYAIPRRIGV